MRAIRILTVVGIAHLVTRGAIHRQYGSLKREITRIPSIDASSESWVRNNLVVSDIS